MVKVAGAEFVARARKEAAATRDEASSVKAEAEAQMLAVFHLHERATQADEQAQRELLEARRDLTRLEGLGGVLRAIWDGLRVSRITMQVEDALRSKMEALRSRVVEANERAAIADRKCRDAEGRVRAISSSVAELGIQRDHLRQRLALLESALPAKEFALSSARHHP